MGGYAILGGRGLGDMAGWMGWDLLLGRRCYEGRGRGWIGMGGGLLSFEAGGDVSSAIGRGRM